MSVAPKGLVRSVKLAVRVTSAIVTLAALVACGGGTASVSEVPGDGGGGGEGCEPTTIKASRTCVPGTAAAGQPLQLALDDPQGCLGCGSRVDACKVAVNGKQITLSLEGRSCPPPKDVGCAAVCRIPSTTCTIPALAAGTYEVTIAGESRQDWELRELVVTASSTTTSCVLPRDPPDLSGEKYARTCTKDEDCFPAVFGDLCAPCKCPNDAISTSDREAYEADLRAASSLCPSRGDIRCAGCAPSRAVCVGADSTGRGTCKLEPGM